MKVVLWVGILLSGLQSAQAQSNGGQVDPSSIPRPVAHYQEEYVFDKSAHPEKWNQAKPGLNAGFGSTDFLYLRSELPEPATALVWKSKAWKGERLNAQILVWSPDTLEQVRVILNDLTSDQGQKITTDKIKTHLIRYVLSNFPYLAQAQNCGAGTTDSVWLMPDRFEKFERFDLPGKTVRPIWLSVEIPPNLEPGIYRGPVTVKSANAETVLELEIEVQNQRLPKPSDWSFRLDIWQNPWVLAWHNKIEPWSEEHISLLKKHLKLYAEAGGKYITTYAVHSPWSDNSYWIEGTMIEWIKTKAGKWKFDYTIFDKYVQLAMEAGVDKAITIYTPVPWEHRFRYRDESSGNYVSESWPPGSKNFRDFWNIFLDDLKNHLLQQGWLDRTYLGINENPLDITRAAIQVIREHSRDWKITYAGDWHAELSDLLHDYSPILGKEPSQLEIQDRKRKGFSTTYYVCCTPARPNNFVFSPPVEGRYLGWYAAANGYDGFLRWAYDAWPQDPARDARHTLWPAGDCFLVYPGGNSSIRFEKLREGISDFEKIKILLGLASKSNNRKIISKKLELEKHLKLFIQDPDYNKRDYSLKHVSYGVEQGRKIVDELSEMLGSQMR